MHARWLRISDAARYAGVCENTMRSWADIGHVRAKRTPGGHRRIDRESIDAPDSTEVAALAIARSIVL